MLEAGSTRELMEMILGLKGKEQLTVVLILWLWWGERKQKKSGRDELNGLPHHRNVSLEH